MRKKNILIAFPVVPFIKGGAEICVEALLYELKKRGFSTDIINLPFQWVPKIEIIKSIITWRSLNLDQFAGKKIDLLITTKFPSYVAKHPNKVVWLFHQHRAAYDLFNTEYSDLKADSTDDQEIRKQIVITDNVTLQETNKIYTIANNISNRLKKHNELDSVTLYHPPKHYGQYYSNDYSDYVLSVGRLEGLKRVDLLIQSMRYTEPQIKCLIAGTGGLEPYLKKLAVQLKVKDKIKFLGFVSEKELLRLYANCFSVYFAPFDEDYGYITLEAFLSKKPIITCQDSGGVMEFAKHKENAFVSPQADPEKIGGYINELYNNRQTLSRELGERGYNLVKDITWDNVIENLTASL